MEITRDSIIESFDATPEEVSWAIEHADEFPEPLAGINDDGEQTLLTITDGCVLLVTYHPNGWARFQYLYGDGSCEETYKRC